MLAFMFAYRSLWRYGKILSSCQSLSDMYLSVAVSFVAFAVLRIYCFGVIVIVSVSLIVLVLQNKILAMKKCLWPKRPCLFFSFLTFFALFLVLAAAWKGIFYAILRTQLRIRPSSKAYDMWVTNPLPIYLEVYLFNITNADEFRRNKSVVPNFREVGPFLYAETRKKVGVSWNDDDETVTFNQTKTWTLVPEASESLSVRVTNLNPITSTMAHISRLWKSKLQRKIVNTLLNRYEHLLVTASAQEWLFDGIPDDFLKIFETLKKVTELPIPYDKFGWFYDRNGSASFDGAFTMKTGDSDLRDVGEVVAWNHVTKTHHYEDECAVVRGSTGEVIAPPKRGQEGVSVFASDICSYVTLKYEGLTTVEGLEGYQYVGDPSVFDNGTHYPENSCFYLGESCPNGARNVSSCRFGSPAFISFPHFYSADPTYSSRLTGMFPDEKKHKFRLKLEPVTGIPLEVDGSFQINFRVEPYEEIDQFQGVSEIYVPMLWFKQTARISEEYASLLKILVFMSENGSYVFYGISFLIFLIFSILTILNK